MEINTSTHTQELKEWQVAPFWARYWAFVIDSAVMVYFTLLITGGIILTLSYLGKLEDISTFEKINQYGIFLALPLLLFSFYNLILRQSRTGQSIGKRLIGIAVVTSELKTPSLRTILIRYSVDTFILIFSLLLTPLEQIINTSEIIPNRELVLAEVFFCIWYIANLLSFVISPYHRGLRDHLAGTFVVSCNSDRFKYEVSAIATIVLSFFLPVVLLKVSIYFDFPNIWPIILLFLFLLSLRIPALLSRDKAWKKQDERRNITPYNYTRGARAFQFITVIFASFFIAIPAIISVIDSNEVKRVEQLLEPKISINAENFSKTVFSKVESHKSQRRISELSSSYGDNPTVFAMTHNSLITLATNGQPLVNTPIAELVSTKFLRQQEPERLWILGSEENDIVNLFNQNGEQLWPLKTNQNFSTYKQTTDNKLWVGGKFTKDHDFAFALAYKHPEVLEIAGGIKFFDLQGNKIEHLEKDDVDYISSMHAADTNQDGFDEIYYLQLNKIFLLEVDNPGARRPITLPDDIRYVREFNIQPWPHADSLYFHIIDQSKSLKVVDLKGNLVKTIQPFKAPRSKFERKSTTWNNQADKPILVILSENGKQRNDARSILQFFNPTGQLIYQEIIADECLDIEAFKINESEKLLLACGDTIYQYQ